MGKYAENTHVPITQSRGEIERILSRYGADQFNSGWSTDKAVVAFRVKKLLVRIDMPLVIARVTRDQDNKGYVYSEDCADKENRRRWRALVLYVKAKLESVESGIVSIEQAFMAHILLPNRQTVGEFMAPQIETAYEQGHMPLALPGY